MNFNDVFSKIQRNHINHQNGDYNCIPFTGMQRLEPYLPGLEKSTYYILTANSGIGKSKLLRNLFIQNPFQYLKDNPDKDIKLKVLYYSLEESEEKIILSEISKYLYYKYRISIPIRHLLSIGRNNRISDDILRKVREAEEYVQEFLQVVKIETSIRNPTGIYKNVRDYAMTIGDYYDSNGNILDKVKIVAGDNDEYLKIDHYKTHHPNHYVIVITDHLKLLKTEKEHPTTKQVMDLYSSHYCLHMRDKFGFTIVNVQQQSFDKENASYTSSGKTIEEKFEPSAGGLGEHKLTFQDANVVLGLFSPNKHNIVNHNGYDIGYLGNNYRSLSVLKNRDGEPDVKLPLFFDGAADIFREMPRLDDRRGMENMYNYINSLRASRN